MTDKERKKREILDLLEVAKTLMKRVDRLAKYVPSEEKKVRYSKIVLGLYFKIYQIRDQILIISSQPVKPKFPKGGIAHE